MTPGLALDAIRIQYANAPKDRPAVGGFSLTLERGRIACLLGPSGCGKSTVLRGIAGFEPLQAGTISVDGVTVSSTALHLPPEKRRVGMVFQDYALFPHLNATENVGFGLRSLTRSARAHRVAQLLDLVGLTGLGARLPHELSGGQQQRVALARALAPAPAVLLLDEPFSNLDAGTRDRLVVEIRDILRQAGQTAVMVTHDEGEAHKMADAVTLMG